MGHEQPYIIPTKRHRAQTTSGSGDNGTGLHREGRQRAVIKPSRPLAYLDLDTVVFRPESRKLPEPTNVSVNRPARPNLGGTRSGVTPLGTAPTAWEEVWYKGCGFAFAAFHSPARSQHIHTAAPSTTTLSYCETGTRGKASGSARRCGARHVRKRSSTDFSS